MARIPRIMIAGEPAVYHVMSRTALDGYQLDDADKDFFVSQVVKLSKLYFAEVFGFCCMGNHFHLLVRMWPDENYSDAELIKRLNDFYGETREFGDGQLPSFRQKLESLSEYVREIKLRFTRYYNKLYGRRGYFWGDRFKNVVVENGQTLINCLAYIDLNPIRAALMSRPEDYRRNSIGYHVQTKNKDRFLSLDFGLKEFGVLGHKERLRHYRQFLYVTGAMDTGKGSQLDPSVVEREKRKDFELTRAQRFKYRTRYFTDSGIIGSKVFVSATYQKVRDVYGAKRDKLPKPVAGIRGVYSLKRLTM